VRCEETKEIADTYLPAFRATIGGKAKKKGEKEGREQKKEKNSAVAEWGLRVRRFYLCTKRRLDMRLREKKKKKKREETISNTDQGWQAVKM